MVKNFIDYILNKAMEKTSLLIVLTSLSWVFLPFIIGSGLTLLLSVGIAFYLNDERFDKIHKNVNDFLNK
jgi:hypothetical protein